MSKKNDPLMTPEDWKNIENTIKKEARTLDLPAVNKLLDKEFANKRYVGTPEMIAKARREEAERRKRMCRARMRDRLEKRRQLHYKPFGGRKAVIESFGKKEVAKKTPQAKTNTAKTAQKSQAPKSPSQKTAISPTNNASKTTSLKSSFKPSKGVAKAAASKSFSSGKSKGGGGKSK
jgi:hypothetical protein